MKKWLRWILCLGLVAMLLPLAVLADGTSGGNGVSGLAIDRLATRSGPSTQYRDTGIYEVKDESVRILSVAYDENDVCWVQCEVSYANGLRRVYTGLKRFDTATFDLGAVPTEDSPAEKNKARVIATSKALYGPGGEYAAYEELTVDQGQAVTIVATENDYAQVEWKTSGQTHRAWVPERLLQY